MGRATQGVTLIGLDEGAKLSGLQRVVENDAENGADNEGEAGEGNDANNDSPTGRRRLKPSRRRKQFDQATPLQLLCWTCGHSA
jgi:hypothetical protein